MARDGGIVNAGTCCAAGNPARTVHRSGDERRSGNYLLTMKLFAEQVRTYVPADDYRVLGTDGFGRSDGRENLRHHFEVD
ncbi:hypothetical protein KCP71_00960 [Salmonella enterica subsp. enterica]|nr:hypothetical protein KCP71_00960 [Salmonella enterica subsp. enterica]